MIQLEIFVEHGLPSQEENSRRMGHVFADQNRANNEFNYDEEGLNSQDADFTGEEELRGPEEKETSD